MKNMRFLFVFALTTMVSCEYVQNKHRHYTNGVVVTESRGFDGVYVEVDTTRDGVADLNARIVGNHIFYGFQKGDTVSVDVRQIEHFANLIVGVSQEKSKQITSEVK